MPAHPSAKFSALTPRDRETIVWSSHAGGYVRLEFANDGPANEGGGSSAKGEAYNRTGFALSSVMLARLARKSGV